jgi:hypothetical protein
LNPRPSIFWSVILDNPIQRGRQSAVPNMAAQWRMRQDQINSELTGYEKADRIYMDEGLAILDLCQRAGDLFKVQAE